MPRGTKAPKLWPAEPVRCTWIVSSGRPSPPVALGDLVAEHRADGAVGVADRQRRSPPAGRARAPAAACSMSSLSSASLEAVVLRAGAEQVLLERGSRAGGGSARGRGRWPSSGRRRRGCRAARRGRWPRPSERKPERGEELAHLLGDVLEERLDELGLAVEAGAQLRVLRGHAHRAGVEVADAHHDAAADTTSGAVAKPYSSAPSSAAIDHVAAGLHLAVGLHDDAVAQAVEQQRLLRLGQAELPRRAGVLERVERAGAGAAVVPGDEDDVGLGLRHAGGHRAHADLGHELHVHAGLRVGVLQVVDELLEILDRVDVVVRRRGDQAHARRGVPGLGDPRVHLAAGQLAALAGLGALGHLDLQVVGVGEVLRRHAEAARRHLLDGAAALAGRGGARRPRRPRRCSTCRRCRFMAMASVSWASIEIEP